MRAVNHVVTGAVIGAVITNPVVALPAAFFSHFVLDVIPHHGIDDHKGKLFLYTLILDCALAGSMLIFIAGMQPEGWLLMATSGIAGASPDLLWLPYWIKDLTGKSIPLSPMAHFLKRIQWCERPWGIYIEIAWLVCMFYLFLRVTS